MVEYIEYQDKYELPLEQRLRLIQRSYARIIADFAAAFYERLGEEGVEIMEKVMYRIGEEKVANLKERLQLDPTDARTLTRVWKIGEDIFGLEAKLVEFTPKRVIEHCLYCPQAEEFKKCPALCERIFFAMDRGTWDALGVKVKRFENMKMLSKGDPVCETVLEIG